MTARSGESSRGLGRSWVPGAEMGDFGTDGCNGCAFRSSPDIFSVVLISWCSFSTQSVCRVIEKYTRWVLSGAVVCFGQPESWLGCALAVRSARGVNCQGVFSSSHDKVHTFEIFQTRVSKCSSIGAPLLLFFSSLHHYTCLYLTRYATSELPS